MMMCLLIMVEYMIGRQTGGEDRLIFSFLRRSCSHAIMKISTEFIYRMLEFIFKEVSFYRIGFLNYSIKFDSHQCQKANNKKNKKCLYLHLTFFSFLFFLKRDGTKSRKLYKINTFFSDSCSFYRFQYIFIVPFFVSFSFILSIKSLSPSSLLYFFYFPSLPLPI